MLPDRVLTPRNFPIVVRGYESRTKNGSQEVGRYVTALNEEGKENTGYFSQDMEMDAYAYSYAVMKYKYGEVEYLYIPQAYQNDEFDEIVNEWQVAFKNEEL